MTSQRKLNKLIRGISPEQRELSYAFNHELMMYGVEAAAHFYLCREAQNAINSNIGLDEFVNRYNLHDFGGERIPEYGKHSGFRGAWLSIKRNGLFIPSIKDVRKAGDILFFSPDYYNRALHLSPDENWQELIERQWLPAHLADAEIVQKGKQFAREMWQGCVEGFERLKGPQRKVSRGGVVLEWFPAQPEEVTQIGREVIKYYNETIFSKG